MLLVSCILLFSPLCAILHLSVLNSIVVFLVDGVLGVVMVLNEAPSEQIQHTWYSRLAQERRELSASVEEALFNTPLDESFWLDGQSQHAVVVGNEKRNNVFPPRLSLQSRSLSGTSSRIGTGLINAQSNKHSNKHSNTHTSIWGRFTRRLTSLFTAFRFHSSVVDTPVMAHRHIATQAVGEETGQYCSSQEKMPEKRVRTGKGQATIPTAPVRKRVLGTDSRTGPVEIVPCADPVSTRFSLIERDWEEGIGPSGGSSDLSDNCVLSAATKKIGNKSECRVVTSADVGQESLQNAQVSQRLAGRITRIRLEVVPAPSSTAIPNKEKKNLEPKRGYHRPFDDHSSHASVFSNNRIPAVSVFHAHKDTSSASIAVPDMAAFTNKGSTSVRLPAIEKVVRRPVDDCTLADGDGGTTSLRLPALEKVTRRREEPSPAWRAGTGMLECGQRDVTISNPSVTASSVVLVMLTANPGPVVVQYVSLQPRKGFTVHLTAPTTIGVPFNYVVL